MPVVLRLLAVLGAKVARAIVAVVSTRFEALWDIAYACAPFCSMCIRHDNARLVIRVSTSAVLIAGTCMYVPCPGMVIFGAAEVVKGAVSKVADVSNCFQVETVATCT